MNRNELLELSDDELLGRAKKLKSASIINALLIGLMFGIVVWSIAKDNFGFLMLIPIIIAYKLMSNSKNDKELKEILKERNLK